MARTISLLVFFGLSLAFSIVVHGQTAPVFNSTPVETGTYNSGYLYEIITTDTEDDDRSILLSSGSLPVGLTLFDNGDGTASISGTLLQTGAFPITLTVQETSGTMQSSTQSTTITVNKLTLTVTVDDQSRTYGSSNPALTVSYLGFVNGDDASDLTTAPTASTAATVTSDVGGYAITASGGVDDNYTFNYVDGTLTVTPAPLTATAEDKSKTYGSANPALTIAYSGFLNGDTEADITAPDISTSATITSGVGAYPVTLSSGGATNYTLSLVNGTLTVNQAILTVTADDRSRTYGSSNPALTVSYLGFVNGDDASNLTTAPTASTAATVTSDIGGYAITASGGVDDNYTFNYVDGTLTITPAPLTATAEDKSKIFGTINPPLTVTYSGFLNGDDPDDIDNIPSISTSASQFSDVGAYLISLSGGTDNNYSFNLINGTLTITKAAATVNISNLNQNFDGNPKPVTTSTAPSGLTVAVTYNGSATVPTNPGTYSVVATIDELNYQGSNSATLFANGPPTSPGIPPVVALEDASNVLINLYDFFDDVEDDDTDLTFNVESNSNPEIFDLVQLNTNILTLDFDADASGLADIVIRAFDTGGLFLDEIIQVDLQAVNDPPSFTKGADLVVNEDAGLQIFAAWATDISPGPGMSEADQDVFFEVDVVTTNGNLSFTTLPSVNSFGELSFRTALNTNGSATVNVKLFDSGPGVLPNVNESAVQSFIITVDAVNDAPVFTRGINPTINEDAGLQTITNWASSIKKGGGNDELSQSLEFEIILTGISPSDNLGFDQLPEIDPVSGALIFAVVPNTNGTANFEVILKDNGSSTLPSVNESDPVNLVITVNAVNDPPSFTKGSDVTVNEDAGTQIINSWATNIQKGGGSDEISQVLSFNTNVQINSGNLTFSQNPTVTAAGQLSFNTDPDAFGVAEVDVFLSDDGSDAAPSDNTSAIETFFITVNAVQDDPVFAGSPVTGAVQDVLYEYNIVANDPDPSDVLTISSPVSLPSWLQLDDNGDGTARLFGTPTNSDIGTEGIVLRVVDNNGNDDTQFFDIVVNNSNDSPFFISVPITAATEGISYIYNITTDDDDVGDVLIITAPIKPDWLSLVDNNDGIATLSGIPTNDDVGANQVRLRVSDNSGAFVDQDFTVTVDNSNDPPSFISPPVTEVNEDALYSYTIITSDPDVGDLLEIRALSKPNWLILVDNNDGSAVLSGTPANQDVGTASIVLNVRDNSGANVNQNFTIIVANTNDPPSFTTLPVTAALQGLEYTYNVSTSDPVIGDYRSISALNLPSGISFIDNGNGTAVLTGTPSNSDFGSNPVALRVADINGAFADQNYTINVDNANDAPSFTSSPEISGVEDNLYTYDIITIDPDAGDTRTISGLSIPDWLILVENGDGTANLSGIHTNNEVGTFSIVLNVRDAIGANVNQNFTVTITNTNDVPFFNSNPITAAFEDVSYTYSIQGDDVDEGDQVTITQNSIPSWLNFSATGSGTALLSGTPTNANLGANSVSLRVTDESGAFVSQNFIITVNNANDPPAFTSNPITQTIEDDIYTYAVSTSDPDAGDILIIRALVLPNWLELTDNSDGTAILTGTPENQDVGLSNVVLNVEDASGDNANQNFAIEVTNTNDPPVFTSVPITGAIQDVQYSYNIVTMDPDLGDSRIINPIMIPSWLVLTDNGNGSASLTGTPANANLGSNTVQIQVTDASGASVDQSFVINVDNINDDPSFTSDPVTSGSEDLLYTYNINTADPDIGDTREITLLSGPDWISLEDFGDGSGLLSGIPLNNDVGSSTIVVNVEDALGANVNQNFTITVDNTNDAPQFVTIPVSIALQDVLYTYDIVATDEDLGDAIVVDATTTPSWLNFDYNGNGLATLQGTPTNSDLGLNDVTLVVEDASGAAVEQIFQINVDNSNDPPFFTSTAPTSINEDDTYTYNIVTDDPDVGDFSIITALSKPDWLILVDDGDGAAALSGTPQNSDVGTVSVVLNVKDGIGANVNQSFSITVVNTNDAPSFTSTPRTGAIQDATYQYDVIAIDDDQGDILTLSAIDIPSWVSFADNSGGFGVLLGIPSNADLGPSPVTLRVTDLAGVSIDQTFVINVDNSNDPPSFTSAPLTLIDEDDLYSYGITTQDPDDSDTRTIAALSKPNWLVITDNGDGTALLQGTPLNENVGDHSIVLEVEDAVGAKVGQSYTITVDNVNDAPGFTSQPDLAAVQDQQYNYGITTTDPDLGDALIIEATTLPAWLNFNDVGNGTASLSGVPQNDDSGDHDVVLRVTDVAGAAVEQLFTISVGNANDPPMFTSSHVVDATEDILYEYNIVTTDEDFGDTRNITGLSVPEWLNLVDNSNGTARLAGIPDNDDVGDHPIVLQVVDVAGAETNQNFTITVANVNDQPLFVSAPLITAQQGLEYTYDIITLDPDVGDMRNITATVLPSWLNVTDNGNGTASLYGTPSNSDLGVHPVVLEVRDNEGSVDTQSFSITADNTNDPPVFVSTPVIVVNEDANYEYIIEVTDPDVGETVVLESPIIASWLSFNDNGDGTGKLSGLPTNENIGMHSISLRATDGGGAGQSVLQEFDVQVLNINDAPEIVSIAITSVDEDNSYLYKIIATDDDAIYGDVLSFDFGGSLPDWLIFDNSDTTIIGLPTNDEVGVYEISLTVSDDSGATSVQSFDLNVVNVNDQPIIVTTPITTINEDEPYSYTIEANDVDVGDVLEFSSDNLPEWLSLVDNGNGTAELSGIPENEDVGTETVRILVTDLSGIEVVQEFDLLISNTNDAPFFTSTPNLRLVVEENYRYSVIADDIDVGDILSISALEVPSFLNFVDNGDGTGVLSGVVPSNPMSLSVELMVEDVAGEQAIQSFTFTVNNAPQVSDIEVLTKEDSVVMLPLTLFEGAYFDLDNDPINGIIIKSLPANGELLSMEGVPYAPGDTLDLVGELLLYHPTLNFSGEDEFMYNIFDGLSTAQDDAELSFVLESVNDKPVIDNLENDAIEYSLGDPGVAITSQATINDVDDTSIERVQITIASNYARGDELSLGSEFVNENIESVFDFESGVLTVQGEGSKSNYENILKNVLFSSPVTGEADLSTKRIDLVLDDGEAESDIFSRSIIISEVFPELDIVNAFTPNNDGVNDTWDFVNLQFYTKINISVFDRDGLLVFECNEQDCEWDGTYNSSALPADSYFYTIDLNDGKREYKGVVAILK